MRRFAPDAGVAACALSVVRACDRFARPGEMPCPIRCRWRCGGRGPIRPSAGIIPLKRRFRIVLEGLRGEDSIVELCRKEGINQNLYYRWSKEFLEAGKKRLAGDTGWGRARAGVIAVWRPLIGRWRSCRPGEHGSTSSENYPPNHSLSRRRIPCDGRSCGWSRRRWSSCRRASHLCQVCVRTLCGLLVSAELS